MDVTAEPTTLVQIQYRYTREKPYATIWLHRTLSAMFAPQWDIEQQQARDRWQQNKGKGKGKQTKLSPAQVANNELNRYAPIEDLFDFYTVQFRNLDLMQTEDPRAWAHVATSQPVKGKGKGKGKSKGKGKEAQEQTQQTGWQDRTGWSSRDTTAGNAAGATASSSEAGGKGQQQSWQASGWRTRRSW